MNCAKIEKLDLSGCSIGDSGAKMLGKAIAKNSSLKYLRLGTCVNCNGQHYNSISDNGALEIAEGISKNKTLNSISMDMNLIKSIGIIGLGKATCKNKAVEFISIWSNPYIKSAVLPFFRSENLKIKW